MSEFVKRTMMGYKEVPGGYTDQECSHIILTKKEKSSTLSRAAFCYSRFLSGQRRC